MENKYYTPTTADIREGYICEELCHNCGGGEKWIEREWDYLLWENGTQYVLEDIIRTKYLDKEDIESLGFEYTGLTREKEWYPERPAFRKKWTGCPAPCYMSDYHYGNYILILDINEGPTWQTVKIKILKQTFGGFSGGGEPDKVIFEGICPSINELKIILKLLKVSDGK